MCGRFYIESEDTPAELERMLSQASRESALPKKGEIIPGSDACVLTAGQQTGAFLPLVMRWGYPLEKRLVINARLESADRRPMFSASWRTGRCLIPASGWFEWDHRERRPPKYRFFSRTSSWFYLAGLYQYSADGEPRFVVITRQAEGPPADIHDRMPLCFSREAAGSWIAAAGGSPDTGAALSFRDLLWEKVPPVSGCMEQISML